jgi:hypothetical protein
MSPDPTGDANAPVPARSIADDHLDELLDDALDQSFPASDPIALSPRDGAPKTDR